MNGLGRWGRLGLGLVVLVVAIGAGVLVSTRPATPQTPAPTTRLVTPGKLTIGYFADFPHMDVVDGKGVGIDGNVMQQVAEQLGLEPVWVPYAFAALIPALQSRRVDTIATSLSFTQPRAQILYYTEPVSFGRETLIVKPGTQIASWADAATRGLTLATVKGFYQLGAWEQLGIKSHAFDSTDACLQDVMSGGASGCAIGSLTLIYRKAKTPDDPVAQLVQEDMRGPGVLGDVTGFGVAQDNPGLANEMSQAITHLWRSGGIDAAYRSVFGDADYGPLVSPASDQAMYLPGPWEIGVDPPPPGPPVGLATTTAGTLTVGIPADTALLRLDGDRLAGPEGEILRFAADRLGLTTRAVRIAGLQAFPDGVDLVAGQIPITPDHTASFWMSTPIGFSPDYVYVKPGEDGSLPSFASWEDIGKAGGRVAVQANDPRIADLKQAGIPVLAVGSPTEGLRAVTAGQALGFVGRSTDYTASVSANPDLANAGIGWVRNLDLFTRGEAYGWGVRAGNGALLDALNDSITAAWQGGEVANAYAAAWPGANVTALSAPGPAVVGTSFLTSKDYRIIGMDISGPWLERPSQ